MTPREFRWAAKAYAERERLEWDKMAWLGATIINPWLSEDSRVTPAQLLGREDPIPTFETAEQLRDYMREQKRRADGGEAD